MSTSTLTPQPAVTESVETLLARTGALAQAFAATAAHHDVDRSLPVENFRPLYEAGLLSLVISKADGGAGGGLESAVRAVSAIAAGEPATALVLAMHYIQHGQIAAGTGFWPESLARRLIRESLEGVALVNAAYVEPFLGSASHGAVPQTSARRVDGQWRIKGHKKYVTGIRALSWIRIMAVTEEPEPRVGFFLVPAQAEGVEVRETWDTLGMRATDSNDVIFTDVAVPQDHFFGHGAVSEGLRQSPLDGPWYLLLLGAVYHGVAQAAHDAIVSLATGFSPGSLGAPLASLPRFQDAIGEIGIWLSTSRRLLRSIARDFDATRPDDFEALAAIGADAAAAHYTVIRNSIEVTGSALELAGNQGVSRLNPFERYHRDTLSARAHNPQGHLTRVRAGKKALGIADVTPLWGGTRNKAG